MSHAFILTLPKSRPSIPQSFIRITSFGVFPFPFYLVTSMVARSSISMFLILTALPPLPLIFPLWIFCVLLFPCACCHGLSQSLHCHCIATALPWQAKLSQGAGKLMLQGGSYPCFLASPVSPMQSAPGGRAAPPVPVRAAGKRTAGWERAARQRVTVQGPASRQQAGLASACTLPL